MLKKKKAKLPIIRKPQNGLCPICFEDIERPLYQGLRRNTLYECKCGWKGYLFDKDRKGVRIIYFSPEEYELHKLRSDAAKNRSKIAWELELAFIAKCNEENWEQVRTNFLAAYILDSSYINKKDVKKYLKCFYSQISNKIPKKSFYNLLEENASYVDRGGDVTALKVYIIGIPDFIIKIKEEFPFFVEVKSGNAVLDKFQKEMIKKLKTMGFKVFVYRGQDWSIFKNELKENGVL
jgi:hypothetical protein